MAIDTLFENSAKETHTETEQAFQLGFVAMTEAIVVAIRAVSFVVILIIMAVLANTMSMTARERTSEYATLKALGFPPWQVSGMVLGESMLLALLGGVAGILLTYPVAAIFHDATGTLFRSFFVSTRQGFFFPGNLLCISGYLTLSLSPSDGEPDDCQH